MSLLRLTGSIEEDDYALVHAMQLYPRASWARLASVLGATPETIERRWRRLRAGKIAWFVTMRRHRCVAYVGASCNPADRLNVATLLAQDPMIQTVELTAGATDLLLTISTVDLKALTSRLLDEVDQAPGLTQTRPMIATVIFKGGAQWRVGGLSNTQIEALVEGQSCRVPAGNAKFSALDLELERALAEDSRMSFEQLGVRTGVSRHTARRRIDRMLGSGVLSIRCDVAAPAFGWPVSASLWIRVNPEVLNEVGKSLAALANVRIAAAVTGSPNLLVKASLRSLEELPKFELQLSRQHAGLTVVDRVVSLYTMKRGSRLLDRDGRLSGTLVRQPDPV